MIHLIDLSSAETAPPFLETLSAIAPNNASFGMPVDAAAAGSRIGVVDIRDLFYRRAYEEIGHFLTARMDQGGVRGQLDALILDFSTEDKIFTGRLARCLHDLAGLTKKGRPRLVLAQQSRRFSLDYDHWCQAAGHAPEVHLLDWHSWLIRSLLVIESTAGQHPERYLRQVTTGEVRPFHYLNLNFTLRPHRLLCLLHLHANRLLNKGLVSFPALKNTHRVDMASVIRHFRSEFPGSARLLDSTLHNLEAQLPLIADDAPAGAWNRALDFDPGSYRKTCFSLVTESDFSDGRRQRFTEKLLKPMLNLHPFVVVGNPGTLELLRDWGFQTFDAFFNEEYDRETGKEARMGALMNTVSALCCLSLEQWRSLHLQMRPLLEANFHRLMSLAGEMRSVLAPSAIARLEAIVKSDP